MLNTIFATKGEMSQVWTKQGKRLPVTKCLVEDNIVLGQQECEAIDYRTSNLQKKPCLIFEIGYGKKKLSNMPKPLREIIKKSGFSFGVKQIKGVKYFNDDEQGSQPAELKIGDSLDLTQTLSVGDVVKVQGSSKGRGFTGVVKRYKVKGGPRTHGQRDRERHIGSIGAMTDPGRVFKGKKMPGHHGAETKTVANLTILHVDPEKKEVWISGPIPGHFGTVVKIVKTSEKKDIQLDQEASGIAENKKVGQEADKETEKKTDKKPAKKETEPKSDQQESSKETEKKSAKKEKNNKVGKTLDKKQTQPDKKEDKTKDKAEDKTDEDQPVEEKPAASK